MIRLAFTGDVMLARSVGDRLDVDSDFILLSESLRSFLSECDYVVGNLECPITSEGEKQWKNSFKASPLYLKKVDCFDLFSLANNHIFDCGKQGARDTINYIREAEKGFCGLLEDKRSPCSFQIRRQSKKIAFLSCAVDDCIRDQEPEMFPRVILATDPFLISHINELSSNSDYVIVLVHGGNEMIPYPEPAFRLLCESFIRAGASAVITHHPHVLGGVDEIDGKYIFYSLGDFIFDGESFIRRRGMIVVLNLDGDKISFNLFPTNINDNLSIDFACNELNTKILHKWNVVSDIIANRNTYSYKYKYRYTKSLIYFQIDRLIFLLRKRGIVYMLLFCFNKINIFPYYFKKIISRTSF